MRYMVRLNNGWSVNHMYYEREEDARHVCEHATKDGKTVELFERTGNGWNQIDVKEK